MTDFEESARKAVFYLKTTKGYCVDAIILLNKLEIRKEQMMRVFKRRMTGYG